MSSIPSPIGCSILLLAVALGTVFPRAGPAVGETLQILAASSTTDAMREMKPLYEKKTNGRIKLLLVFAASSTLARQIQAGAPANLFLSAHAEWTKYLNDRDILSPGATAALLSNTLVLVARRQERFDFRFASGLKLSEALAGRRLVIGDPGHVPAGRYARQALRALGQWQGLQGHLAYGASVRDAVALIARTASAGIVYATDVQLAPKLRVIDPVPGKSHRPIRYELSVVKAGDGNQTRDLWGFLQSDPVLAIFRRYGFRTGAGGAKEN